MAHKTVNDKVTGKFIRKYSCDSCQLLRINGVVCHEPGCTEAWQDEVRECKECGGEFKPEQRNQIFCDTHCANSCYAVPCDCHYCEDDEEID